MAVVEEVPSSSTALNANNLVLLVILVFPIMSLLNNHVLRSKPLLWWLGRSAKMKEFVKSEEDDDDFDCVICLSEVLSGEKFRVLPKCKHRFHGGCIDAWLETGQWSCPVCRSHVAAPPHRNGGEGRGSGDGAAEWILLGVDKFCNRFFGTIRSEIMAALYYQECYLY